MTKRWITLGALACRGMGSVGAAADSGAASGAVKISAGFEFGSGTYGGTEDINETLTTYVN